MTRLTLSTGEQLGWTSREKRLLYTAPDLETSARGALCALLVVEREKSSFGLRQWVKASEQVLWRGSLDEPRRLDTYPHVAEAEEIRVGDIVLSGPYKGAQAVTRIERPSRGTFAWNLYFGDGDFDYHSPIGIRSIVVGRVNEARPPSWATDYVPLDSAL